VDLLLKCGYPFSEQEEALRKSKAARGFHRVKIAWYRQSRGISCRHRISARASGERR
jgi:hypothetical protein